jgi:hypothetical protein
MRGPVQILVVGYEQPTFSGEVLAELSRLREVGIVRLLDVLIVSHQHDGTLDVLAPPADLPADTGRLAAAVLGRPEGSSDQPSDSASDPAGDSATDGDGHTWSLADAIPIGTTAAVALIEHTWAGPLRAAVQRSGGKPLDETWLAPEDLELVDRLLGEQDD